MDDKEFSKLLNEYMNRNNLTRTQFARMLGISRQTLSNWLDHDNETVKRVVEMIFLLNLELLDLDVEKERVIPPYIARKLSLSDRLMLLKLAKRLARE